jgi:hypothetical protein
VIVLAVRWYLRYGLCYRDVEELLAERGITVDHDITAPLDTHPGNPALPYPWPAVRQTIPARQTGLPSS